MPTDILMLSPTLKVGGAERLRAIVAPELACHGYDVRVCLLKSDGPFACELKKANVPVDVLGIRGSLADLPGQMKLRTYLREHSPSVVISGQFLTNFHSVLAARAVGVPTVIIEEHGFNDWKKAHHKWVDWSVTGPRADGLIACSRAVARHAMSSYRVPPLRVRSIHNCVDASALDKVPEELLGSAIPAGPVVGTVGTLRQEKGHRDLLAAWESLTQSARIPDAAELWFVGDGPMRDEIEAAARANSSIRVLGTRSDIGDVLRCFDVFAFPSTSEGFGIALAEAMYLGVAPIASDSGGIPELIVDGKTGLLVAVHDADALADGIAELLNDDAKRSNLGSAAKADARERFCPSRYARQLVDFAVDLGAPLDRIGPSTLA